MKRLDQLLEIELLKKTKKAYTHSEIEIGFFLHYYHLFCGCPATPLATCGGLRKASVSVGGGSGGGGGSASALASAAAAAPGSGSGHCGARFLMKSPGDTGAT